MLFLALDAVTIAKQAVRYQNINLYFKPRTEQLFTMITTRGTFFQDAMRPQEAQCFM